MVNIEVAGSGRRRVLVVGATGYIGRHVVAEFVGRGWEVVSFARVRSGIAGAASREQAIAALDGSEVRFGDVTDPRWLLAEGFRGEHFDAVACCLASRTGRSEDAWKIDYEATRQVLDMAKRAGVRQFVLLSAICVQNPVLAFQRAKIAAEEALIASGLTYSIVRPTAFFKSLAGQVARVQRGQPYVMFGNGSTVCRPISEADLARFMAECIEDPDRHNRVLPVGGPGTALSARARGDMLFELTRRRPRFRRVPLWIFDVAVPVLTLLSRISPGYRTTFRDRAEFARIGRFYAREPMLLWNPVAEAYDDAATPAYGRDTLREFYARVIEQGLQGQELGDHAMFD